MLPEMELFQYIYKTADMGCQGIDTVEEHAEKRLAEIGIVPVGIAHIGGFQPAEIPGRAVVDDHGGKQRLKQRQRLL